MKCRITQFARESVGLCPLSWLVLEGIRVTRSNSVNRIIKITQAHNLHLRVLDFIPFTIRTYNNANCLLQNLLKRF